MINFDVFSQGKQLYKLSVAILFSFFILGNSTTSFAEEFIQKISASYSTSACVIQTDETILCWGEHAPQPPPSGKFIQISEETGFACAIRVNNTIECWGRNDNGESTSPAGNFTQVSAGWYHACGLRDDGTIECWGRDNYGQSSPPAGTFIQVSAGGQQSCGIKSNGWAVCWGGYSPEKIVPPQGVFTQIATDLDYACGIQPGGAVSCWGVVKNDRTNPPSGIFTQISAGQNHACGIREDGTAECWGLTTTPPEGTFTQVDSGGDYSCGIRVWDIGDVAQCWGHNGIEAPFSIAGENLDPSPAPEPTEPDGMDKNIRVTLEEPSSSASASGISNLRGWAVAPNGIERIELFINDVYVDDIPYGSIREDVGNAFPTIPNSDNSGFSMAWAYSTLNYGSNQVTVVAYDSMGNYNIQETVFNVEKFNSDFISNPNQIDLRAVDNVQMLDNNRMLLEGLLVEGEYWDVVLKWQTATQGFDIESIEPSN